MKFNKLNRRMFLQGTGGLMFSIPFLNSLMPREAWGQEVAPVKRYFGTIVNFNFGHHRNWLPKLTPLSQELVIPGSPHRATYDTLMALKGDKVQLSQILNSSLNPYLNQMMVYKGLDIPTHGFHDTVGLFGNLGRMNGVDSVTHVETIDRVLCKSPNFDPAMRNAIHLGPGYFTSSYYKNALGEIVAVPSIAPRAIDIYNILFNKGAYPESGEAPLIHPRRDVLSRVFEDYKRVSTGRQISTSDKIVLASAMDKISDLQKGLRVEAIASCRHKGQDSTTEGNRYPDSYTQKLSLQNFVNLAQAIYLCDISRVLTMAFGIQNNYDISGNPTKDYHGNITHNTPGVYNNIPNWQYMASVYSELVSNFMAPLLGSLSSIIDPANGKSFLHNGLVHFGAESVYAHRQVSVPTVTFGSLNGAIKTGYMVNYSDSAREFNFGGGTVNGDGYWSDAISSRTNEATDQHSYDYPGIPYQRFLVTVLQAMGLKPEEYERAEQWNAHLAGRTDSLYGEQNNGIARVGGFGQVTHNGTAEEYHFVRRLRRYNFHYYRHPLPLPG